MNKFDEQAQLARALSRNPTLRALIEADQENKPPKIGFPKEFITLLLLNEEYPHLFEDVDLLDVYCRYQESIESGGDVTASLAHLLGQDHPLPIKASSLTGYRRALRVLLGQVAE